MSLALIRDDSPALPGGVDLASWTRWLQDVIVPDWRPGEWDPQALLFTGEFEQPSHSRELLPHGGVFNSGAHPKLLHELCEGVFIERPGR